MSGQDDTGRDDVDHDRIQRVIGFWREAGYAKWFNGGAEFDAQCREHLGELHMVVARRECDHWMAAPEGAAALLVLLDQIPRNIFRGSGHAFATDPLALLHARHAVDTGLDRDVAADLRPFVYMPFEHSESLDDQHRAVELFAALGDDTYLGYAKAHLEVIERFGRFPHRNRALGRISTADEQAWLDAGGGF